MDKFLMLALLCLGVSCTQETKTDDKQKSETTVAEKQVVVDKSTQSMKETVEFYSKEGIIITGDVYMTENPDAPFILLFHQANYSRGEYLETAPKLNELGFNCIAVDQRSGKEVNGVENTTHAAAVVKKLPTEYIDALEDLRATIEYAIVTYSPGKLIIWGSSYSASLTFIVDNILADRIDAILAFSPGEYFTYEGKKIEYFAKNINIPVFITSAKSEEDNWKGIYNNIPFDKKVAFIPKGKGVHGSRALWSIQEDKEEYWEAVTLFLNSVKEEANVTK